MTAISSATRQPSWPTHPQVVVHCWGGSGRTGKVLAAWLVRRHGLSAADAAAEVVRFAGEVGTNRNASAEGVGKLLAVGTSSS